MLKDMIDHMINSDNEGLVASINDNGKLLGMIC